MTQTEAPATKPLSKSAQAELAKWDRELPTWSDENLAGALNYWTQTDHRGRSYASGAGQKRWLAALQAETARRSGRV